MPVIDITPNCPNMRRYHMDNLTAILHGQQPHMFSGNWSHDTFKHTVMLVNFIDSKESLLEVRKFLLDLLLERQRALEEARIAREEGGDGMTAEQKHAQIADFPGLYFRHPPELQGLPPMRYVDGTDGIVDLKAFNHLIARVDELRQIFEKLEAKGVHIPNAYWLDTDAEGNVIDEPHKSWSECLRDIQNSQHLLWSMVDTMLIPEMRDIEAICCG